MTTSVIVAGARTPVGKLMGSLKGFSGSDLGAIAIKGALEKAGVDASIVDYVIMGQVLTAGAGQMPARQSAVAAAVFVSVIHHSKTTPIEIGRVAGIAIAEPAKYAVVLAPIAWSDVL